MHINKKLFAGKTRFQVEVTKNLKKELKQIKRINLKRKDLNELEVRKDKTNFPKMKPRHLDVLNNYLLHLDKEIRSRLNQSL